MVIMSTLDRAHRTMKSARSPIAYVGNGAVVVLPLWGPAEVWMNSRGWLRTGLRADVRMTVAEGRGGIKGTENVAEETAAATAPVMANKTLSKNKQLRMSCIWHGDRVNCGE